MAVALDTATRRDLLQRFDFVGLFIELGWDYLRIPPVAIERDGHAYILRPVAEKKGVQIFECAPGPDGRIPPYAVRRQIERELTKQAHEHLIIFVDANRTTQTWQWVTREHGRPARPSEHTVYPGQSGQALLQALDHVTFHINDEEGLTLLGVVTGLTSAFDKDRVTKKFYDRFQKEHGRFLGFIEGIADHVEDQKWYASVMLNRLMFVYFIQKQGFLDGNTKYLTDRLQRVRAERGDGQFHIFYKAFLRRLFHGLNTPEADRDAALERLIGRVPYLNGGLFDEHELEQRYPKIDIPDEAFDTLFAFFDAYTWHLDDRPLRDDSEINPDVLGYIFEKYVNQKQMGAYYTKEDITGYIAKNTVIPAILDKAKAGCAVAFRPGGYVWRLLQENPDRYLYDAVKKGVDLIIPPAIAAGLDDVTKRGGWNRPADPDYALPTETWREYIARRQRYEEVWTKLVDGEVTDVNDLITLNLNVVQFAEDVIDSCEGRDLLAALYDAIKSVTVLDPTCGSGAFLFAALTILEPLYDACLDRMHAFIAEPDPATGEMPSRAKYSDFRDTLAQIEKHPNREYFVLKSIILNNLYGVDIMEEAVEICKLRLFLKLVSQLQPGHDIEPLPDIDFNIRAGNTLVGFAKLGEVERAITQTDDGRLRMLGMLDEERSALARIQEAAEIADRAFQMFHRMQTEQGMEAASFTEAKHDLRDRLQSLRDELDGYLAADYDMAVRSGQTSLGFDQWRESHQPFHWLVEFYGIMQSGGFDVVVGNPPYVSLADITYSLKGFSTLDCGDVYAPCVERSLKSLLASSGRFSMIIPISSVSTAGYQSVRDVYRATSRTFYAANFAERPSKLFEGVDKRLSVLVATYAADGMRVFTTGYERWVSEERPALFQRLQYVSVSRDMLGINGFVKIETPIEKSILNRLMEQRQRLGVCFAKVGTHPITYTRKLRYFVQFFVDPPRIFNSHGEPVPPSELKFFRVATEENRDAIIAALNSSLFFWFFIAFSDCRNVNTREIIAFPLDLDTMNPTLRRELGKLAKVLLEDFTEHADFQIRNDKRAGLLRIESFQPRKSKPIIDDIDRVLAKHYGFTDGELDFIINYDVKYRMGRDAEAGGE